MDFWKCQNGTTACAHNVVIVFFFDFVEMGAFGLHLEKENENTEKSLYDALL